MMNTLNSANPAGSHPVGSQQSTVDLAALQRNIEDLKASDEAVLGTLNSILTDPKSTPEARQMAVRFFQERQEKESLLSQLIRAMGETAQRVIGNIR